MRRTGVMSSPSPASCPRIGVVHLVRASNGAGVLRRFLVSLSANPGGVPHELILVFKGFDRSTLPPEYGEILEGVPHRRLFVRDYGYDIRPYFLATRAFDRDVFCFLNSFSILLDPQWLEKLLRPLLGGKIGLVGATGAWISHYTNLESDPQLGREVSLGGLKWHLPTPLHKLVRGHMLDVYRRTYGPFPNPHIRTNAFLLSSEVLRRIRRGHTLTKPGVYRFESGSKGLTRQIQTMGLRAVVVGRDGKCYYPEAWPESNTFWQGEQENLLIADNRTALYATADSRDRRRMAQIAWGENARPSASEIPRTIR